MTTRTAIWAHRGASDREPENTLAAFLTAGNLGADGVELDVRRSADDALVVHHDAALPDGRLVCEVRASELPSHVPLLASVLEATATMTVNIEVKNLPMEPDFDPTEGVAFEVAKLVDAMGARARVVVSSFGLGALDAVQRVDPTIRTGWLTLSGYDQIRALATVVERGHDALHPHHSTVTAALVDAARVEGVALHAWTVDDPEEMVRLARLGLDAIITNVVDAAVAAVDPGRHPGG